MTGSALPSIEPKIQLILKVRKKARAESFAAAHSSAIIPIVIVTVSQHAPQTPRIPQPATPVSAALYKPTNPTDHA